jgi:hypothetical protein
MPRRRLRPSEIREAQEVFGLDLPYGQIWIHEHARWPNWVAAVGAALARKPAPAGGNSVTLGRSVYFPHPLRTEAADLEAHIYGDMAWLIHELAHVWQHGHGGYRYAWVAVREQVKKGPKVYAYGGEDVLRAAAARHASLSDFNPEQQGDIARDYYLRRKLGSATAAWEPFIAELRSA